MRRPVVRADKRNRAILARYESVSEAERKMGVGGIYRTCQERLVGPHTWYLRFEEDFDPDEDFMGRMNCPVIAVDVGTGQAVWYTSAANCARALGVSSSTVTLAIRNKGVIKGQYSVARYGKRIA